MLYATLIGLQLLIPLGLLAWLSMGRDESHLAWLARAVAVAGYLVAVSVAGLWTVLPVHLPFIYGGLFLIGAALSLRGARARAFYPAGRGARLRVAARAVLALVTLALAGHAVGARRPLAAPMVDLAFPLHSGTYYVANGGSRELVNAHLMTLDQPRMRRYRGQSYGIDLLRLHSSGLRAKGLAPRDPSAYAIFGDSVYAPCAGTVLRAIDGLPDLAPPRVDREHMEGNHVLLDCGGTWVLLGHLQQGSVQPRGGESARSGQALGRVGNSGNSDEPHLHIHAQLPGSDADPLSGKPIQILFDGRYLVRNALVRSTR